MESLLALRDNDNVVAGAAVNHPKKINVINMSYWRKSPSGQAGPNIKGSWILGWMIHVFGKFTVLTCDPARQFRDWVSNYLNIYSALSVLLDVLELLLHAIQPVKISTKSISLFFGYFDPVNAFFNSKNK